MKTILAAVFALSLLSLSPVSAATKKSKTVAVHRKEKRSMSKKALAGRSRHKASVSKSRKRSKYT